MACPLPASSIHNIIDIVSGYIWQPAAAKMCTRYFTLPPETPTAISAISLSSNPAAVRQILHFREPSVLFCTNSIKNIKLCVLFRIRCCRFSYCFGLSACDFFRKIPVTFIHIHASGADSRNCALTCILPHIMAAGIITLAVILATHFV